MQESGTEQPPAPARKTCPAAGSHSVARTATAHPPRWRAPPAATARHQLPKKAQLLNLQPSLHQEMRHNYNTAVKRSAVCPVPAVGTLNGQSGIPARRRCWGGCVMGVVARILFLRLCQSMSHCTHLLSKRDTVRLVQYKQLLINLLALLV